MKISEELIWYYRRGLVSKALGEQIQKYLDEKKENK